VSALLEGRRAVITGGARGLGAAIVRRFAGEGAHGAILDRERPAEPPPEGWTALMTDVTDEAALAEALRQAGDAPLPGEDPRAAAGPARIDVLVVAAGVVPGWAPVAEQDLGDWDRVFAVNARGVMATIKAAVPAMGSPSSIVVMASLNAWRGDPNIASYVASKHAALGIVRSAALDLGPRGIRVNALAPGPIATEALLERMATRERERGVPVAEALAAAARATALGRIATAEEVASAALFLAGDLASGITGHLLPVDAGIP
jgi:NAD(P)-dependent dehydrogenase (short-subunit alcohol dehydrogenase family)